MKSSTILRALGLVAVASSLSACGLIDMPNKMDQTNASMAATQAKIDATNKKMQETNEYVRKQDLMVALDHMMSAENTRTLSPAPLNMMPWGQEFATKMHEDEFVQLVYLDLKDINEVTPDDSQKDPQTGKWPSALVANTDHDKLAKFSAVEVISGFAPQSLIEEMVNTEITQGGQFNTTALAILEARALFVHDILLNEDVLAQPLDNPGKISVAVERAQYLDYIVKLPFAASIGVKTYGMLDPNDNVDLKLDPKLSLGVWDKINQAFDKDLQAKFKGTAAINTLQATVQTACQSLGAWDGKNCSAPAAPTPSPTPGPSPTSNSTP